NSVPVDPNNPYIITSATYDAYGNKLTQTNANGRVTHFAYDTSNTYVLSITNPAQQTTYLFYNGVNSVSDPRDYGAQLIPGTLERIFEPNGWGKPAGQGDTLYVYDALGRLIKVFRPLDGLDPNAPSIQYTYQDFW